MKESDFQRTVIEAAQLYGWIVAHFRSVRTQRKDGSCYFQTPVQADGAGFPDLFMVKGNRAMAIEIKVGRNKPSPAQQEWLELLRLAGIETHVWRETTDWDEIEGRLR